MKKIDWMKFFVWVFLLSISFWFTYGLCRLLIWLITTVNRV